MRTFSRSVLPVLVLLLVARIAHATTDAPPLVQIDATVTWMGSGSNPTTLMGTWFYNNGPGPGYVPSQNPATNWSVTGNPIIVGTSYAMDFSAGPSIHLSANLMSGAASSGLFDDGGRASVDISFASASVSTPEKRLLLPGDYALGGLGSTYFTEIPYRGAPFSEVTIEFASSGSAHVVAVPELKFLRRLLPARNVEVVALVNPHLQSLTAWGATWMLRAVGFHPVQRGTYVDLKTVSLEVAELCSGLFAIKGYLLAALLVAVFVKRSLSWKVALILVAPLIALEVNMLRVAGVGLSMEVVGSPAKDGIAWAALVLGGGQIVGLGWLMNRRARTA